MHGTINITFFYILIWAQVDKYYSQLKSVNVYNNYKTIQHFTSRSDASDLCLLGARFGSQLTSTPSVSLIKGCWYNFGTHYQESYFHPTSTWPKIAYSMTQYTQTLPIRSSCTKYMDFWYTLKSDSFYAHKEYTDFAVLRVNRADNCLKTFVHLSYTGYNLITR